VEGKINKGIWTNQCPPAPSSHIFLQAGVSWWLLALDSQHASCQLLDAATFAPLVNKPNAHSSAHAWVKGHGSLVM